MPHIIIHVLSNILLIYLIYFYEKKILKKKSNLKNISLLVFLSQLIDLDHLLAKPIYNPLRCSINFHPLHSWYSFPFYALGMFWKKYSYLFVAIGLHLALDALDCFI